MKENVKLSQKIRQRMTSPAIHEVEVLSKNNIIELQQFTIALILPLFIGSCQDFPQKFKENHVSGGKRTEKTRFTVIGIAIANALIRAKVCSCLGTDQLFFGAGKGVCFHGRTWNWLESSRISRNCPASMSSNFC